MRKWKSIKRKVGGVRNSNPPQITTQMKGIKCKLVRKSFWKNGRKKKRIFMYLYGTIVLIATIKLTTSAAKGQLIRRK